MKTRLEGFYWVKYNGNWVIAEWQAGTWNAVWYLCGDPHAHDDNDFEEFGEKIIKEG